ncbi:MAG: capsule assembly Wzi family protein [Aquificae bacterium]|nr:capsule assembly Wzi family protein [Aquificota bacterium]
MKFRYIYLYILLVVTFGYSNPLINLNTEETEVYDNAVSSISSQRYTVTIKPFSGYKTIMLLGENVDRVKPYLNTFEYPFRYIKPLNSFTTKLYITNEEYSFIEGQAGLKLRKGVNLFLIEDGLLSIGENFAVYYQFRQNWNKKYAKFEFLRWYLKFKFWKLSVELGRDNVNLGPGEYGMLLSNNAYPFPMVKIQTEESLNFLGKWDFVFLRGWLVEDRKDVDNPNILALRITWKPKDWLEIGGTKTTLYGGDGRPGYSLLEYWDLITSSKDNVSYSKFDNDSLAQWDISLYLPLKKWFKNVKIAKFYWLEGGSDVTAFWQEEENGEFRLPFGFQFHYWCYQVGFLLSTQKSIFRLEYASTDDRVFIHHIYNYEGYTYKGVSLGYPYGRNIQSLFFKHRYYFDNTLSVEYKLGAFKQPGRDRVAVKFPIKMTRYYAQFLVNKKIGNFILEGFFRLDKTDNYDKNPLPTQFDMVEEDKTFYILGFSFSYRI